MIAASETADTLLGIAAVLSAGGVFVAGCATAFTTWKNRSTLNVMNQRGIDTHNMVTQVDRAVNGKPAGETTMVQQVQDATDRAERQDAAAEAAREPVKVNGDPMPADGDSLTALVQRLVLEVGKGREETAALREELSARG